MMNCRWCGGQDHSRVSSKKCKKYSKWKELKTAEAKQVFHKSQCVSSQIAIAKRKNLQKKRDVRRKDTTKRKISRKKAEKTRKDTKKRKLSRQQAEKTRKDTPKRKLSRQQADSPRGETCVQLMKQILSDRLATVEGIDSLLGELPPVDDFLRHNFIRDLILEDWFNILARCRRLRPEILRLCINRLRMFIRLPKFMTQTHL